MDIITLLSAVAWATMTYVTLGMICGGLLLLYRRSLRKDVNKHAQAQICGDSKYLTDYEAFLARASLALFGETLIRWPVDLSRVIGINGWFKAR
jgi:hypothetical protein